MLSSIRTATRSRSTQLQAQVQVVQVVLCRSISIFNSSMGATSNTNTSTSTTTHNVSNTNTAFNLSLSKTRMNTKTSIRWHGGPKVEANAPTVPITFINPHPATARLNGGNADDDKLVVDARVGETLLQVAQRNDIDLEGACEGVCACSTCHVVFEDEAVFDSLPEESEDEEDMLDMAFALTATSRLGCQVKVTEDMNGMVVRVPAATRNFYVDGHVPQPH
jgi:ferredoxin